MRLNFINDSSNVLYEAYNERYIKQKHITYTGLIYGCICCSLNEEMLRRDWRTVVPLMIRRYFSIDEHYSNGRDITFC